MVKVVSGNMAPMHNSSEAVQRYSRGKKKKLQPLVIPFTAGIYANARFLESIGEIPIAPSTDEAGFLKAKPEIVGRPTSRLLERLGVRTPEVRAAHTRQMETLLGEQLGHAVRLDDKHPTAPLLIWSDRQMHVTTQDGNVLWGWRGPNTGVAVAHGVPAGSGFASVDADNKPVGPRMDAKREMQEETGLIGAKVRDLGIDRKSNTLGVFAVRSEDKTQIFTGVLPAFSYAATAEMGPSRPVLQQVRLNHENSGVLLTSVRDLERLAAGERVVLDAYPSTAPEAVAQIARAKDIAAGKAISAEAMQQAATDGSIKIAAGSYPVDVKAPVRVEMEAKHFRAVGRDFLAEALQAIESSGRKISPQAQDYVRDNSRLEPVATPVAKISRSVRRNGSAKGGPA